MTSGTNLFTDGAAYERLMGRWSKIVGQHFLQWLALPQGLRWIDVGCGTGVFTAELIKASSPSKVLAIDPSAEQLAYARKIPSLDTTDFQVGDAQEIPSEDNSLDVAVMALVIHFVPNPARAVAEMARVVRPGGCVASYVWDYSVSGSPSAPIAAALKSLGLPSPPPPSASATSMAVLTDLWHAAGLANIQTTPIRIPVMFSDFEDFWSSMTVPVGPVGKAIADMAPESVRRLRQALQEQASIQDDGTVVYEAVANSIKGHVAP